MVEEEEEDDEQASPLRGLGVREPLLEGLRSSAEGGGMKTSSRDRTNSRTTHAEYTATHSRPHRSASRPRGVWPRTGYVNTKQTTRASARTGPRVAFFPKANGHTKVSGTIVI